MNENNTPSHNGFFDLLACTKPGPNLFHPVLQLVPFHQRPCHTISGTEVMWIVAHKGKLFSATSYWNNTRYHGPQMLLKESPDHAWMVDHYQRSTRNENI